MIYTWECQECKGIVEVSREPHSYLIGPMGCDKCDNLDHRAFKKVILKAPSVPFRTLKQSGMFADDNGNFAPRSV